MSVFSSDKIDRLSTRLASIVSVASERVKEAAEKTLSKDSPLEKNLKEAISDKNWGCSNATLWEISRASHNYNDYHIISKCMWDAISEQPKRWRRIFKGLSVLEFLLKNGNERFVDDARHRSTTLQQLQRFSWREEGRDKGAGIREKAELCCVLAFDANILKEARETAAKNRSKYVGISSSSSQSFRHSSSSANAFGSSFSRNDSQRDEGGFGSERHHNKNEFSTSSSMHNNDAPQHQSHSLTHHSSASKQPTKKGTSRQKGDAESSKKKQQPMVSSNLLDLDFSPEPAPAVDNTRHQSFNQTKHPSTASIDADWADFTSATTPGNKASGGWDNDAFGSFQAAGANSQNRSNPVSVPHQAPATGIDFFPTPPQQSRNPFNDSNVQALNTSLNSLSMDASDDWNKFTAFQKSVPAPAASTQQFSSGMQHHQQSQPSASVFSMQQQYNINSMTQMAGVQAPHNPPQSESRGQSISWM